MSRIADDRRRRHRHGLHRHRPRRGAAPHRRPGPRRARQHAGARRRPRRGPRRAARLRRRSTTLLADPTRRGRPRHLAQRPPPPAGEADPGRRPARHLREAAGDDRRRVGRAGRASPPRPAWSTPPTSTSASTRSTSTPTSVVTGGELGDVRLVTGRYFQDWLLLETDWNWRLQPERGGALRAVGDIGSHWLDLMTFITGPARRRGDGRPGHVHRRPPRADRAGRDVLDRASPPRPSARDIATEDAAHDPAALRERRPRRR